MRQFRITLCIIIFLLMKSQAYADCIERPQSSGEEQHGQQIDPYQDLDLNFPDFTSTITVVDASSSDPNVLAAQVFNYLNEGNPNPVDYMFSTEVRGEYIRITNTYTGEAWSISQEKARYVLNYFDENRSYYNGTQAPVFPTPVPFCDTPTDPPPDPWEQTENPFFQGGSSGGQSPTPPNPPDPCPTDENVKITADIVASIYPNINRGTTEQICTYINQYKDQFGVIGRKELAYLLSQVIPESGSFTVLEEKWDYSTVARVKAVFGRRVPDWQAPSLLHCQCLFNKVYANEGENGDSASGDGFKYRGRGIIQLTHKESYRLFGNYLSNQNIETSVNFVTNPELVASNLKYAVLSALWEFGIDKRRSHNRKGRTRIDDAIANDDIGTVSALINGKRPAEKLAERRAALNKFITKFCL